jgi:hypothetical protein
MAQQDGHELPAVHYNGSMTTFVRATATKNIKTILTIFA